jgi:hypothetical protein
MTLDQFVMTVEERLVGLGKRLWRENSSTQIREQAEELSEALQDRIAARERCREELAEARKRLSTDEAQAALLVSRIETYVHVGDQPNAWQHALQLDHVRESLRQDRARREDLERQHRALSAHVERLERSLANLQEKLYQSL